MMPLTNSQLAAQARETARKYGTTDPVTQHGPVMLSRSFGRLSVAWVGDRAEVRDESGAAVHAGTRDECLAWAEAHRS